MVFRFFEAWFRLLMSTWMLSLVDSILIVSWNNVYYLFAGYRERCSALITRLSIRDCRFSKFWKSQFFWSSNSLQSPTLNWNFLQFLWVLKCLDTDLQNCWEAWLFKNIGCWLMWIQDKASCSSFGLDQLGLWICLSSAVNGSELGSGICWGWDL